MVGRPDHKLSSPDDVYAAIETAKQICAERKTPLTIERIAACLGMERRSLRRYADRTHSTAGMSDKEVEAYNDVCDAVYRAYLECQADAADALNRLGNTMGTKFLAINNYDYVDKVDTNIHVSPIQFVGADKLQD